LRNWGKKYQGHESKREITEKVEGEEKGRREVKKSKRGSEHDQSTLYACMEISQFIYANKN
jgi:hypothetical protein